MENGQHPWDMIRERSTSLGREGMEMMLRSGSKGAHESLLRSWHVVSEVKKMLGRGDSPETVRSFIDWIGELPHRESAAEFVVSFSLPGDLSGSPDWNWPVDGEDARDAFCEVLDRAGISYRVTPNGG